MKEFCKSHKKIIIPFFIACAIFALDVLTFFIIFIGNIKLSFAVLEFPHLILSISLIATVFLAIVFIAKYIDHVRMLLRPKYSRLASYFMLVLDVILLYFILSLIVSIEDSYEFSNKCAVYVQSTFGHTMFFKVFPSGADISSVYDYWGVMPQLAIIISLVLAIICLVKRISKINNEKKDYDNDKELGFVYKECEFYKQVGTPYTLLKQANGTLGEFELYKILRQHFKDDSFVFNREIPKDDGLATEADLIVLHKRGIFVLENKHYTTKIYGKATDHDLTLIDHIGRKQTTYNPILQNEKHVSALKTFLTKHGLYIDDVITPIHSIVVFTADSNDRTDSIIEGIDTENSATKVCTSQNVAFVMNRMVSETPDGANIDTDAIRDLLLPLSLRAKSN